MPAIPALELETGVSRGSLANPMALSPSSVSLHGKILVSERHCLKKPKWTAPKEDLNTCPHIRMWTNIHSCTRTLIYNVATY